MSAGAFQLWPLVPAALLVGLWLIWVPSSGGYFPSVWYPSASAACALALLNAVLGRRFLPPARAARVALLAFAAIVALNYLSVAWAAAPGDALQAANKLLLYLAVAWTLSLVPFSPRSLALALGIWSVGIAAFCAVGLAQAVGAPHLDPFFDQLRYSTPLGYSNATAALAVMGMWPALILSTRPEVSRWIRVALLTISVFLAEFAFLPQSRGAVVALALTAILALVVSADRVRLLARMLIVGAGLSLVVPRTVALDNTLSAGRHAMPALRHIGSGMLLTCLASLILGALLILMESRWDSGYRERRRVPRPSIGRRGVIALAVSAAVVFAGVAVAAAPHVAHLVRTVWHSGRTDASTGSTRLLSASPEERFDYARVAFKLFSGSPLGGVGAGNFGRGYDASRHFQKHSQYAHDLALRALSETGILGLALLVTVIVTICVGLAKTGRQRPGLGRACATASFLVAAYFLTHASLDWLDEFPALAVPALSLPLAAIALSGHHPSRSSASHTGARFLSGLLAPRGRRAVYGIAIGFASLAAALTLGLPYLADRYMARAVSEFRARPSAAYHDLSQAATLNPFAADAYLTAGMIAVDLAEPTRARSDFALAIARQDTWFPHFELALLAAQDGDFTKALQQLSRASSLDAADPTITQTRTALLRHERLDAASANSGLLLQGAEATVFRTEHVN